MHTPVLRDECLSYLSPDGEPYESQALLIDSTLGEGGHTAAFLAAFPGLTVVGVDADEQILRRAQERLAAFTGRVFFYHDWFDAFYASYPDALSRPDIILFDLGISLFHYERSQRGFSFRYNEPLDMRLAVSAGPSASDMVNTLRADELADIIYAYGGEKLSRRIARAIVTARTQSGGITSSRALADIIYDAVPVSYRHAALHPATRTFQALRIAVNGELRRLPAALHNAFSVLNCGGKMGVITFHSLEDAIVKRYFRALGKQCVCPPEYASCLCGGAPCAEVITHKPVTPSAAECAQNAPSRSAKLRVVKKLRQPTAIHMMGTGV